MNGDVERKIWLCRPVPETLSEPSTPVTGCHWMAGHGADPGFNLLRDESTLYWGLSATPCWKVLYLLINACIITMPLALAFVLHLVGVMLGFIVNEGIAV